MPKYFYVIDPNKLTVRVFPHGVERSAATMLHEETCATYPEARDYRFGRPAPLRTFYVIWHNEMTGRSGAMRPDYTTQAEAEERAQRETAGKRPFYAVYVRDINQRDVAQYREGRKVETSYPNA